MKHLASRRHLWYAISLIVILPGVVSLLLFGLRQGIDFTGGTLWELKFERSIQSEEIQEVLADHGYGGSVVQISSDDGEDNVALIRMRELKQASTEKQEIQDDLVARFGPFDPDAERLETVGATVGREIRNRAFIAVGLASVGILFYIAYAFRNTQNPALYGICAIVAMLHDVLIVVGVFSILGEVANVEIDALFVTALLTVIGFSVHDTIVVFDRIRENLAHRAAPTFVDVVNYSLAQTVVRSVNNSITVVFTLLALFLFGGESTQEFVLALLIGVIAGTYSSIFNASQLLVSWETGEIHRLFGRTRGDSPETLAAPTR